MITINRSKILILAPHTDDGELGCGGTIARFIEDGTNVFYVAFSTASESLPKGLPPNMLEIELRDACKILGIPDKNLIVFNYEVRKLNFVRQDILEHLVRLRDEIAPDIVFMPSPSDLHQDHSTVAVEGLRAFKKESAFAYELPWNNITFTSQAFIPLDEKHIAKKIEAVGAYKSQSHRDYTKPDAIRAIATMRGLQIGVKYAECFEVLRWIIR
ncbi:MAG: PIG-L deacetylase family protein [bacterium]